MSEKLENSQKAALVSILPEGWSYYFTTGLLVIYQDLPELEIVRRVSEAGEEEKEIFFDEVKVVLAYTSKDVLHWTGEGVEVIKSNIFIKGLENMILIFSKRYNQACKTLCMARKKLI